MYKENKECKYHLPFGMLLSDIVNDSTANGDWPDFLNHCPCALVQDESVLMKALGFLDPTLDRAELPNELGSWLQEMVRFIKEKYQNRNAFQTLLSCMTVMDENGQRTLGLFRGDGETSIALKRHIAEFLGAPVKYPAATLKRDAFKLVYCLLTLPNEFGDEIYSASDVLHYESPSRGEGTFYCKWCCETLAELTNKYKDNMHV
jgi:hypothetical protein